MCPPERNEKGELKNPPTSSLSLIGDFVLQRLADFDDDNDGEDVITSTAPYDGGYYAGIQGDAKVEFKRLNGPLDGTLTLLFQKSYFGGVDSRLLPHSSQATLGRSPVIRVDDVVSVENYFFKVTPSPYMFLQVGRLTLPTKPDNVAGREAAEGFQIAFNPRCGGFATITPSYAIMREGLNGFVDEHDRDADVVALDVELDWSKWTPKPRSKPGTADSKAAAGSKNRAPAVRFALRYAWDRGRDFESSEPLLDYNAELHDSYGTLKRWTIGTDYVQAILGGYTVKGAAYHSRLRRMDAAANRQQGHGTVVRGDLISPDWGPAGQLGFTFARGAGDDPSTPLIDEGFLGNDQRRFAEGGDKADRQPDSIFFGRLVNVAQVRQVDGKLRPAFGLGNKTYAALTWNSHVPSPDGNPLRNLLLRVKYRSIWQRDLGDATGFAGSEVALRVMGVGTWTPYAGLTYYRPGMAMRHLIARTQIVQFALGATVQVPLFDLR